MDHDPDAPPLNPLPPVVWLLVLPIVGIELFLSAGQHGLIGGPAAVGWRTAAIEDYGFFNLLFDRMIATGDHGTGMLLRFVSYAFVSYSATQTIFVVVFILALGKMVAEVFSSWAVLVVFFGSAILGAAVYGLALDDPHPLVGGYPAVYGLIGAFTFILWVRLAATGGNQSRAFMLIGFLLGIQLLFRLLFGGSNDWVADIAGFATGFALSFVVSPGGWARVRARLRHR